MGVARIALPPGLCLVSRTPLLVRAAWTEALRTTGLLPQILQRLGASDQAAPLSDLELQPFLDSESGGLRKWLGCDLMQSGLNAWRSDSGFICFESWPKCPATLTRHLLISWQQVWPWAFRANLHLVRPWPRVCPRMLTLGLWNAARLHGSPPYLTCRLWMTSSRRSSNRVGLKRSLGGLSALDQQYSLCAVGKLGLVQAPGRPPRLVVCCHGEYCSP